MKKDTQLIRHWKYKLASRVFSFGGDLRFSFMPTKVTTETVKEAFKILEPCDVVLTGTYNTLSRTAIKGSFTHALLYTGKERTIEALSEGVDRYLAALSLSHADYFVILRPNITADNRYKVLKQAERLIGNDYGFLFQFVEGDQLTVCTEVILRAFKGVINFKLKDGVLLADDIYDNDRMKLTYESSEVKSKAYLHKDWVYYAIFVLIAGLFIQFRKKRANRGI